jgi:hypothetical protein
VGGQVFAHDKGVGHEIHPRVPESRCASTPVWTWRTGRSNVRLTRGSSQRQ